MTTNFIKFIILATTFVCLIASCTDEDEEDQNNEFSSEIYVESLLVYSTTYNETFVEGYIFDADDQVIDHGVYYSDSPHCENGNKISLGELVSEGYFETIIENLKPNSTYYTRAYAFEGKSYILGDEVSFITQKPCATLKAESIINTGLYKADPECFGGPFYIYYLKLTYEDPYNVIKNNLSNIQYLVTWDSNNVGGSGCLARWNPESIDFFEDYPISVTSNSISVPFGCSLGDNNSDACYIRISFVDIETGEAASDIAMFSIIRGENY